MTLKPAHDTPGLSPHERDAIVWAEDFTANSTSPNHRRLLEDYLGGAALPAKEISFYPEITGRAAGVTGILLRIIAEQAAELGKLRGQVAEFAAASADVTRRQMADQDITGKELSR